MACLSVNQFVPDHIRLAFIHRKVLFGLFKHTDIRLAVTRNLKELFRDRPELQKSEKVGKMYELLESNKSAFDPRVFLPPIMDTVMYGTIDHDDLSAVTVCIERGVKEVVGTLIVEFGCVGKAPLVERVTLDEMAERYRKAGI